MEDKKIIGYKNLDRMFQEPPWITISCVCDNCGIGWSEAIQAWAVKNSLYHYDYCSECKGAA